MKNAQEKSPTSIAKPSLSQAKMLNRFNLTIQEPGEESRNYELAPGIYHLGREPACEVVLMGKDVSRVHARLTLDDTHVTLEDLGSSSGSYVAGLQIHEVTHLEYPSRFALGSSRVAVEVAELGELEELAAPAVLESAATESAAMESPNTDAVAGTDAAGATEAVPEPIAAATEPPGEMAAETATVPAVAEPPIPAPEPPTAPAAAEATAAPSEPAPPAGDVAAPAGNSPPAEVQVDATIVMTLDAKGGNRLPVSGLGEPLVQRLELLYESPLLFATVRDSVALYQTILARAVALVPGAGRGGLLILDPATGEFALWASIPAEEPPIARPLMERAAQEQRGFIWSASGDVPDLNQQTRTGICVPLVWNEQTLGVLCVDDPAQQAIFREEDLQFVVAVARYAAATVASQIAQHEMEQNHRTLEHLMESFSPEMRRKLLEK